LEKVIQNTESLSKARKFPRPTKEGSVKTPHFMVDIHSPWNAGTMINNRKISMFGSKKSNGAST
jgi:hypothetical protein